MVGSDWPTRELSPKRELQKILRQHDRARGGVLPEFIRLLLSGINRFRHDRDIWMMFEYTGEFLPWRLVRLGSVPLRG